MDSPTEQNRFKAAMRIEAERLQTFQHCPLSSKLEASKMAKWGFFNTGKNHVMELQCSYCDCLISHMQDVDQVFAYHRSVSPNCPFAAQSMGRNLARIDVSLNGIDVLGGSPVRTNSIFAGSSPANGDFRFEETRLATFAFWPIDFIKPEDLAKSGFVYAGRGDCVRCVFCNEYVGDWKQNDSPNVEHRSLFPHCPFMRGLNVGNVPKNTSSVSLATSSSYDCIPSSLFETVSPRYLHISTADTDIDVLGQNEVNSEDDDDVGGGSSGNDETGIRRMPQVLPIACLDIHGKSGSPSSVLKYVQGSGSGNMAHENIGIISHSGPKHPKYSTLESRLKTFRDNWPPALKQTPLQLSRAGFHYIGLSDQVKCFYCDGGLRNWQPEDDPWIEHARWFSKCGFVRLVKGDDFISRSLLTKPPPEISQDIASFHQSRDHLCVVNGSGVRSEEVREEDEGRRNDDDFMMIVSDREINNEMLSPLVNQVLLMGFDPGRVKAAVKRRLQEIMNNVEKRLRPGNLEIFESVDELALCAMREQSEQEDRANVEELVGSINSEDSQIGGMLQNHTPLNSLSSIYGNSEIEDLSNSTLPQDVFHHQSGKPTSLFDESAKSESYSTSSSNMDSNHVSQSPIKHDNNSISSGTPFDLELENRRLKDQRTCRICMDAESNVVFLPCGHLICCVNCAPALKDCPFCRQNIRGTVKAYMS